MSRGADEVTGAEPTARNSYAVTGRGGGSSVAGMVFLSGACCFARPVWIFVYLLKRSYKGPSAGRRQAHGAQTGAAGFGGGGTEPGKRRNPGQEHQGSSGRELGAVRRRARWLRWRRSNTRVMLGLAARGYVSSRPGWHGQFPWLPE